MNPLKSLLKTCLFISTFTLLSFSAVAGITDDVVTASPGSTEPAARDVAPQVQYYPYVVGGVTAGSIFLKRHQGQSNFLFNNSTGVFGLQGSFGYKFGKHYAAEIATGYAKGNKRYLTLNGQAVSGRVEDQATNRFTAAKLLITFPIKQFQIDVGGMLGRFNQKYSQRLINGQTGATTERAHTFSNYFYGQVLGFSYNINEKSFLRFTVNSALGLYSKEKELAGRVAWFALEYGFNLR